MQFHAVVATFADAPDQPRLRQAWPMDAIEEEPLRGRVVMEHALREVWTEPGTLTAAIVVIEVPDAEVRPLLPGREPPVVRATAAAAD